jgi:membrane fusion protein (multidrug efflux system)
MHTTDNRPPDKANEGQSPPAAGAPAGSRDGPRPLPADRNGQPEVAQEQATVSHPAAAAGPPAAPSRWHRWRKPVLAVVTVAGLGGAVYALVPWVDTELNTVSTDDAYVNGHVTYVAPRVAGQVAKVLVDDNYRVKKGDLLLQLDKEPYRVQVEIKTAAVKAAESDLVAAKAQVRGLLAQAGSQRWKLQNAMEVVDNQVALLKSRVAALRSAEANRELADANLARAKISYDKSVGSKQDFDTFAAAKKVSDAQVNQALEDARQVRVTLGLPPDPPNGDLTSVPPDLNQRFSAVRQALADLVQTMAQVGLPLPGAELTPTQVLDWFHSQDPSGNIDQIIERLVPQAPAVKQAEARLLQARSDLDQANLNLKYCDVVSDIAGVVTGRSVNPGNNVQAGQQVMAVRSLTEIWIDANFKETQLAELRIGQRVRCEVDMYGSKKEFEGRITGFTMGTGQTLSLLPPQNATGNFVKIVQRLPVRVELTDYDPDKVPLFVGLSVTPYVYYKESATGPHAGAVLQPFAPLPTAPTSPKP